MAERRFALARWVEPWYTAHGLTGMLMVGVAPILIPLTVDAHGGGATAVGAVVAAFNVGGLFAPMIGGWADRTGRQQRVFLACFPLMAATLTGFALVHAVPLWAFFAVIFGGASPVAGTVAGLFIVEGHPQSEWNDRISWFGLACSAGQVLGLPIAAVSVHHLRIGWLATACLCSPAGRWADSGCRG